MTPTKTGQTTIDRTDEVWAQLFDGELSFRDLEALPLGERIAMVRAGVPASVVGRLAGVMDVSKEWLYEAVGVPRSTGDAKARAGQPLGQDHSDRVLGLALMIGQVERIVQESGETDGFDAARWLASWLDRPHPALSGQKPAELLDATEGRAAVSALIGRMQSGAYA